ncbi:MAG: hypothetical protein PHE17_14900 [Thiothrix sp.]|uniref:hypothetical protein n=1 Tax=Thiothrix sp. TaxID=1032 RepID=UPI002602946C|nr:hypothetical protein [Thiothrix sp.]MDD5394300.1 hypothetical protein [Thiothrix sp.]
MNDNEYVEQQATIIGQRLVGGTITQAVVAADGEFGDANFGFEVLLPSGVIRTVWVLSDPEGNNAGFLEIKGG